MAYVPTEAEIDAMSEDELDAYLAQGDDSEPQGPGQAPEPSHVLLAASGAPRSYAWLLIVASLIGIAASWELMLSEIKQLREPLAELSCDINPLVSCGASLSIWQGNLLGVPNSFIGAMAFAVLACLGGLLLSGTRLPRWVWWALCAGTLGGLAFVAWFLGVSVLSLGRLCPFCMIIWAAVIPVATCTWGQAALGGHLGVSRRTARALHDLRWWIAALLYLLVLAVVVTAFWSQWTALVR